KNPEDRYQTPAEVAAVLGTGFSPGSESSSAPSGRERTVVEGVRAVAGKGPSRDTLDSAWAYMAQGGDTEALEPGPGRDRNAAITRRLLVRVAGGSLVLLVSVALWFLLFKQPAEKKPQVHAEDPLAGPVPPPKKPPATVTEAWLKEVAAKPADKQVEAVVKKLKELNPGFDGTVTHQIESGVVRGFRFVTDQVREISPLRRLRDLTSRRR